MSKLTQQLQSAYREGVDAANGNYRLSDNPYNRKYKQHLSMWNKGFLETTAHNSTMVLAGLEEVAKTMFVKMPKDGSLDRIGERAVRSVGLANAITNYYRQRNISWRSIVQLVRNHDFDYLCPDAVVSRIVESTGMGYYTSGSTDLLLIKKNN